MQNKLSYWEKKQFTDGIDLLIIGSGIVGLSAALEYRRRFPTQRILIIERGTLPAGGSTRNAGFACFGSPTELLADLKTHSEEAVIQLIQKRWQGLAKLRSVVGDQQMNYQPKGNFEIFRQHETAIFQTCVEQLSYLNQLVEAATGQKEVYQIRDKDILHFGFANTKHLIWNRAEGMIDTGKMMRRLLRLATQNDIQILNGVSVIDINDEKQQVSLQLSNGWLLKSQRVVIATNGFASQLIPELALTPARNQVLITKPISGLKINGCFHLDSGYYYFRNIDHRILLGGGRHLDKTAETTTDFGTTPLIQQALLKLLKTVILPNQPFEVDYWWSGILGVGEQKQPIIRRISENVVVAVRMGGMGVAIGSLVGVDAVEVLIT